MSFKADVKARSLEEKISTEWFFQTLVENEANTRGIATEMHSMSRIRNLQSEVSQKGFHRLSTCSEGGPGTNTYNRKVISRWRSPAFFRIPDESGRRRKRERSSEPEKGGGADSRRGFYYHRKSFAWPS